MLGPVKLHYEQILQVTFWEPTSSDERNEKGRGVIRNPFHCFTLLLSHSTEPCWKESHDKSATTISGTLTPALSLWGVFRRVLSSQPEPGYKIMHEAHVLARRINPLKPELNPICYFLALLGAHHFLHVSRIRVKILTFRRLMSYTYGTPILDVSRSHTTQHSR